MATAVLPPRTHVAIVGAGPTGLALAVTLASAGVECAVLDRAEEPAATSRAVVVHARTLEVLDKLGARADLVARGLRVDRFVVREQTRQGRARRLIELSLAGLDTPYPYALCVPQRDTEAVLHDRLRALGGDVHRGCEATSLAQDEDGVTVTLADGRTIRAAYVVGADGMRSTVRAAAGIGFAGSSYDDTFVVADVVMDAGPGPDELVVTLGPAGFCVVCPLPGGRYRVIADVDDAPPEPGPDVLRAIVERRMPDGGRVREVPWASRFRIHRRVADRFVAGRVLLAGDAAHVHSPAGGQGMNIGIQDARVLGGALVSGRIGDYEARRRPVALRVAGFTDRATRLTTARGPLARRARGLVLLGAGRVPAVRARIAAELAELTHR